MTQQIFFGHGMESAAPVGTLEAMNIINRSLNLSVARSLLTPYQIQIREVSSSCQCDYWML